MLPANDASGNYLYGRPDGWETLEEAVFVVTTLTEPATVTVNSGGNVHVFEAPAGASAFTVPMGVGSQAFSISRNGKVIQSGVSLKPILDSCVCGLYNFNPYGTCTPIHSAQLSINSCTVGTLPPGTIDSIQSDGYAAYTQGLRVSTCAPTPSLGVSTPTPPSGWGDTPTSTSSPTSTTSTSQTTTTTTTRTPQPTDITCIAGTGSGNYVGLCSFACHYGYCPNGVCTCTQSGAAVPTPPTTGTKCLPQYGLDESYLGLWSFACDHGYIPSTACRVV
jgi:hypothetical protein